jgi:hypothetical protein
MSNMSYCKYRNTLKDLQDCHYSINEDLQEGREELGREEWEAMQEIISLCKEIAEDHEEE